MMTDDKLLPEDLVWRDDGHPSDLSITALADGERDLVPLEVLAHVHGCAECGERLGEAALLACEVDEALRLPIEVTADEGALAVPSSGRRLPLPLPALAAALVLAGIGAAPALMDLARGLPQLLGALAHHVPMVLATLALLVRGVLASGGPMVTGLWCAAALVLVLMGVWVTRLMPLGPKAKGELS